MVESEPYLLGTCILSPVDDIDGDDDDDKVSTFVLAWTNRRLGLCCCSADDDDDVADENKMIDVVCVLLDGTETPMLLYTLLRGSLTTNASGFCVNCDNNSKEVTTIVLLRNGFLADDDIISKNY